MTINRISRIAIAIGLICHIGGVSAQNDATELAKQDQNPFTRFSKLMVEENAQMGFGPDKDVLNYLRVQPMVPFELNDDWSVITRSAIPIVHLPFPQETDGLSDISLQVLLTPNRTGQFLWGVGPTLVAPTATEKMLGSGKWAAGPIVGGLYINGPWVFSTIASNVWSFAGDESRRDVNTMSLRPTINYNLPNGWYLTSSPSIIAVWGEKQANRWLVPMGGGVGKVFSLGDQLMSTSLESYYHIVSPTIGPDWQLRFQVTLLFPK